MDSPALFSLTALVFCVAMLYASVGHGGASGYLAVLSFFAVPKEEMATTALVLNVLVAGIAWGSYARAGHFSWKLTWPFLAASVPMAFLGGLLPISDMSYFLLLAGVLVWAAWRLWGTPAKDAEADNICQPPHLQVTLPVAGGVGFLSGMVGVGGGIFLSPLMLLMRWATVKQTAATSACFIVVNSLAGLGGRALREGLALGNLWPLLIAGGIGSILGSFYGAHRMSGVALRRLLAVVLLIAAFKMVLKYF